MTAQPDNIIRIENLSFRYPGAAQDTLRNVNLTVARGDFVAIIGGNGSAKTTLCKTLNGLVPHYWSGEFAGTVEVDGIDTWTSSVAELSHRVGYVYQDFSNQLVRPTVADEVRFGPVNFGRADLAERADDTLARLGIVELSQKFVWQLSGGQAHLTALASVLSLEPTILVVDEPVAELDPQRAEILYERLAELNQQHGITIITIEHHAEFIARYARSVVLMAEGTPVWHLPIDDALGRLAELEKHGIPAPQTFVAARALGVEAIPRTVTEAVSAIAGAGLHPSPQWPGHANALDAARCGQVRGDVVARAVDVSHGYRSVHGHVEEVLSHVDLDLHDGDRIALVGGTELESQPSCACSPGSPCLAAATSFTVAPTRVQSLHRAWPSMRPTSTSTQNSCSSRERCATTWRSFRESVGTQTPTPSSTGFSLACDWPSSLTATRAVSRADSNGGPPWRSASPCVQRCCCSTSQPRPSTSPPETMSRTCSRPSPTPSGARWWPPMTCTWWLSGPTE